jgi:hypothetical protein
MVSERGIAGLTALLILAALGIGYGAAKVHDHPVDCRAPNMDIRCLFGGGADVDAPLPTLRSAPDEDAPVGGVSMSELQMEGAR